MEPNQEENQAIAAQEDTSTVDPVKPQTSWIWIKDSSGYPSITVTFLTIAFYVTTLAYIASIVENIGPVKFRAFDAAASSAYFIPLLTLYFGRRWTDAKLNVSKGQQ